MGFVRRDRRGRRLRAGAFAYTAGWLPVGLLTPTRIVDALAPPSSPALGHRRNHVKGICVTGVFEANGNAVGISGARALKRGRYPVVSRFNLGTPDPDAPDATVRVRGMGLQIWTPDGQVWHSAMISAPIFPVATPEAFYEVLKASASKSLDAMPNFVAAHSEFANFGAWAKSPNWTTSMRRSPTTASTPSSWCVR